MEGSFEARMGAVFLKHTDVQAGMQEIKNKQGPTIP